MSAASEVSAVAPVDRALREGTVPDPAQPHLVLWNTAAYADLRPEMAGRHVHEQASDGRPLASFAGVVAAGDDGRRAWVSGHMAPFGGPDFCRDHESVDKVAELVAAVVEQGAGLGVDEIVVRTKPPHYSELEAYTTFQFLTHGFALAAAELNGYVDLRPHTSHEAYEASLRKETRKALRATRAQPLDVALVERDDEATWAAGHEVLRRNRHAKGRPMHLSLPYLAAVRDTFPGLVRMLVLRTGGRVVAASVVYRMARARDYVVYWGDADHDLAQSPMPLLASEVMRHCLETGAATVDLGICSADGVANPGLVQFKRSMGAQFETRFELVRRIEKG